MKNKEKRTKTKKRGKALKIAALALALLILLAAGVVWIVYTQRGTLPEEEIDTEFMQGLAADDPSRREANDTRVMSANLLAEYESWGGSDAAPRAKQFLEVLKKYQPDAVGLQEVSGQWFCLLNRNLPDGYRFVSPAATGLLSHFTAIVYNETVLTLLDSGSIPLDKGTDTRTNRIEWAQFEQKDNGAQFLVTTTQFDRIQEGQIDSMLPILRSEAEQLLSFIKEKEEEYHCPVIVTGDFSAMENTAYTKDSDASEIYELLASDLTDTKNDAAFAKSGLAQSLSEPSYDHIFFYGDGKITTFRLLSDLFMQEMSDHYPLYADIVLPMKASVEGTTA